jgi:hypothetical protein
MSARFCPAQGPASTRERSRTRICESGPGMMILQDSGNSGLVLSMKARTPTR